MRKGEFGNRSNDTYDFRFLSGFVFLAAEITINMNTKHTSIKYFKQKPSLVFAKYD